MLDEEDLKKIQEIVKTEVQTNFKTELKPIKSDIAKIRRDITTIVGFFDSEILDLRARVERLENILNVKPSKQV